MSNLGPLERLHGEWEGNVGLDVSFGHGVGVLETSYYEKAWFEPIPVVVNGTQTMYGLNYEMTAWRHGEEDGDPFHDEVGYFLWEAATGRILRCFAVPRGITLLAGGTAAPGDDVLEFRAESGSSTYGILQNPHLAENSASSSFVSTFTFEGDDTFSHTSTLTLDIAAMGGRMDHTDSNTLHRTAG